MAINITDMVPSKGEEFNICDQMNDYISKLEGAEYKPALCMGLQKKISVLKKERETGVNEGDFVEPIWIWKKTLKIS